MLTVRDRLPAPFDSPFVRRMAGRVLLPLWFVLLTAGSLLHLGPDAIGVDARIYYRGSAAWLAGGSPWDAAAGFSGNVYHYAALPSTTVLFAPATLLPEDLFVALWLALGVAAAVWTIRVRLGMPWWWLAFPPLAEGMFSGNPSIVLLALVLSGRWWLEALAPPLKLYGGVPLAAQLRIRSLVGAAAIIGATVLIAPELWSSFFSQSAAITARLLAESAGGFGANAWPVLFVIAFAAVAALAVIDRPAAGWLAVPAIWPASEFHYSTLALPVMTAWLGALLALPIRGLPAIAVIVYVVVRFATRRMAAPSVIQARATGDVPPASA